MIHTVELKRQMAKTLFEKERLDRVKENKEKVEAVANKYKE